MRVLINRYRKLIIASVAVIAVSFLAIYLVKSKLTAVQPEPPEIFTTNGEGWSIAVKSMNAKPNFPLRTSSWWKAAYINPCDTWLYPYPYILNIKKNIIGIGVPSTISSDTAVIMAKAADFLIQTPEANHCSVTDTGSLSATFVQDFDQDHVLKVTAAKGLGFIHLSTNLNTLTLAGPVTKIEKYSDKVLLVSANSKTYGVIFDHTPTVAENNVINLNNGTSTVNLSAFYVPANADVSKLLAGVYTTYPTVLAHLGVSNNKAKELFSSPKITLWYLLPTQRQVLETKKVEIFDNSNVATLRGNMTPVIGSEISLAYPINMPLDINSSNFSDSQKADLKKLFDEDMKTVSDKTFASGAGSYWQGKTLFKHANMLHIAHILGDTPNFDKLKTLLTTELNDWSNYTGSVDTKYFVYDGQYGGLVSSRPEYGHETYSDHYFQHGYFIYAYTILSMYDDVFKNQNKPIVDYLIKDIANTSEHSKYFPYQRHFDMFEGHGYASGLNYFVDGNNQESSSEAVNAWYSAYLWEKLNNNVNLANQYLAMLTLEETFVQHYYFRNPTTNIIPNEYKHDSVGILWEGKYDYATWFGNKDEEVVGIQLLPLSLASGYLKNEKVGQLTNAISNLKNGTIWYDIIASYKLLNSSENISVEKIPQITDTAHSQSWLYFVLSQLAKH